MQFNSFNGYFSAFLVFFAINLTVTQAKAVSRQLKAHIGTEAQIPCKLDKAHCGDLHNVKWYRNSERVFVFSDVASISRPEGENGDRLEVIYMPNTSVTYLRIRNVQLSDEAIYKCEITYIEVKENCDLVQAIQLETLVKPSSIDVYRKVNNDLTKLENDTILGPLNEETNIELQCVIQNTKPAPTIVWYNGSHILKNGDFSMTSDSNGLITAKNALRVTLLRGDLWKKYECRTESYALERSLSFFVSFDINVRPVDIELSGIENHVIQGTNVILKCSVSGARPAVNVTWFNGSEPISNDKTVSSSSIQTDGTYFTTSELLFAATRFENGHEITCEAENLVLKERNEPPIHSTIMLEVFYPPLISISPANVTVNETANVLIICNYEANPQQLLSVKWLKNNQKLDLVNNAHYEGGTIDNPSIILQNVTREDLGEYSCQLENVAGAQRSTDVVFVNVLYPPAVKLIMEPSNVVMAKGHQNVTLKCMMTAGNPKIVDTVRWFLNGSLLKELSCDPTNDNSKGNSSLCPIDVSQLLLKDVNKGFAGNYSCDASSFAGLGHRSKETQLIVYYPPSGVSITFEPNKVVKKSIVTLSCHVADRGIPDSNLEYVWYQGQHLVPDIKSSNWTITPVTLQTETNFTCIPRNLGGDGEEATVNIDVYAPPTFISKLSPYSGALFNSNHINISCRVECSPECSIFWLKNGEHIDFDHTNLYYIRNILHPADLRTNDFESIQSILVWNMTSWPDKVLNAAKDSTNYTCQSSSNSIGPGVQSTTYFAVEYPPEKINVSNRAISVIENNVPEKILCWAKGNPDPSYVWKTDITKFDSSDLSSDETYEPKVEVISKGNILMLNTVTRSSTGYYICEAFNKHGNVTQKTYLNVMYKPECSITQGEFEDNEALICSANSNPHDVNFAWKIKGMNDSVMGDFTIVQKGLQSFLILDSSVDTFRTYLCYANNTIGVSVACERDVAGALVWWKRVDQDHFIIIIAIIVAIIVCFFVICIILIIICRRKQNIKKYKHKTLDMDERQNDGNSSLTATSNTISPQSKWPLKPGVHVHVNKTHSLSPTRLQCPPNQRNDHNGKLKCHRNIFKEFFSGNNDFLSNIHHGVNGVITFKKFKNCSDSESRDVRSKQGSNPTNTTIKNTKENHIDNNNDYYENLPFHGLQSGGVQQANKPISRIAPFNTEQKQLRVSEHRRHRCYSPILNSLPCRKHGYRNPRRMKKRTIEIHFIPKRKFATLPIFGGKQSTNESTMKDPKSPETVYQNLSDSIQIYEHDDVNDDEITKSLISLRPSTQTSVSSGGTSSSSSTNYALNQYLTFPKRQKRQSKVIPSVLFRSDNEVCSNSVITKKKKRNILPLFDLETGTTTGPFRKSHSFRFESAQAFFRQQELKNKYLTQKKSRRRSHKRIPTPVSNSLTTDNYLHHKEPNMLNGGLIYADLEMIQMNVYRTQNRDEIKKDDDDDEDDEDDEDLNRKFVLPQKIVTEYATLRFFNDKGHQIDV